VRILLLRRAEAIRQAGKEGARPMMKRRETMNLVFLPATAPDDRIYSLKHHWNAGWIEEGVERLLETK
jgi:hypothetical protein